MRDSCQGGPNSHAYTVTTSTPTVIPSPVCGKVTDGLRKCLIITNTDATNSVCVLFDNNVQGTGNTTGEVTSTNYHFKIAAGQAVIFDVTVPSDAIHILALVASVNVVIYEGFN